MAKGGRDHSTALEGVVLTMDEVVQVGPARALGESEPACRCRRMGGTFVLPVFIAYVFTGIRVGKDFSFEYSQALTST
jgi:hypothetical protein